MTEWEPATEVEAAMRDALRAGDQELYFRILARSELLLPVSSDALAGRAPVGWGTWTTNGRTHVLAFTSGEALRICLADNAGSARRLAYHELAGSWPNLEWWLAVNPGLPIEGYLPAWFVSQLARGDVRLPGRTLGARARLDRAENVSRARARATVPGQAAAGQEAPGQAMPGPVVPGQAMPGSVVPGQVVQGQVVPGQVVQGPSAPGPSAPAPVVSGQIVSGQIVPGPGAEPPARPPMPTTGPDRAIAAGHIPQALPSAEPARGPVLEPDSIEPPRRPTRPPGYDNPIASMRRRGGVPPPGGSPLLTPSSPPPPPPRPPYRPSTPPSIQPAPEADPSPRQERSLPSYDYDPDSRRGPATPRTNGSSSVSEQPSWATPTVQAYEPPPVPPQQPSYRSAGVTPGPETTYPPVDATLAPSRPVSPRERGEPEPRDGDTPLRPMTTYGSYAPAEPASGPPSTSSLASASSSASASSAASAASPTSPAAPPRMSAPPPVPARPAAPPPRQPDPSIFAPTSPASFFGTPERHVETPPPPFDPGPSVSAFTPARDSYSARPASPVAGQPPSPAPAPISPPAPAPTETAATVEPPRSTPPLSEPIPAERPAPASAAGSALVAGRPADPEFDAFAPAAPDSAAASGAESPYPTVFEENTAVPVDFQPANDVEESLLTAAGEGSTDTFLSTLLLAKVLLPVAPDSAPGARPGGDGFVWRTEVIDDERYVVVFTSPERLADHLDEPVETVTVKFVQLISRWPEDDWSFAVNPGTPVGAKLPGSQIVGLASWAAEFGLSADDEPGAPAQEVVNKPAAKEAAAPARRETIAPTMMQKTIAPSQVDYYLDRGYDRVSGFVHRVSEVAHLTTPANLFTALGLGYSHSPFSAGADEVYVLRWPAYRPSLYRIPYGGQNETAMRAMEGWVIERSPFRGNGFAPGEGSDVIAEFKVDSARLPHGAELVRIGSDGSSRVIAVLDADAPGWRRVGDE